MPVAIAYAPGVYGTYLEWCLSTLCSTEPIVPPFTSVGNSHKFDGNHYLNIKVWFLDKESSQKQFFRLHPKVTTTESVIGSTLALLNRSNKVILLYPDKDTTLLCLNNFFFKIRDNRWKHFFETSIDPNVLYSNWPVSRDTKIEDVRLWIQREFLSFYLIPFWKSLISQDSIENFTHPQCLKVTVTDLLLDFVGTMSTIDSAFDLGFKRPVTDLLPYHEHNLRLQRHLSHDALYQKIVDSVVNNIVFEWDPIGICGESYIQWELRNRGWEIRCDGLDIFPTSSIKLKELLYTP